MTLVPIKDDTSQLINLSNFLIVNLIVEGKMGVLRKRKIMTAIVLLTYLFLVHYNCHLLTSLHSPISSHPHYHLRVSQSALCNNCGRAGQITTCWTTSDPESFGFITPHHYLFFYQTSLTSTSIARRQFNVLVTLTRCVPRSIGYCVSFAGLMCWKDWCSHWCFQNRTGGTKKNEVVSFLTACDNVLILITLA